MLLILTESKYTATYDNIEETQGVNFYSEMPIDIFAFAYAAPVAGGGILGYVKSNSIPSLAAGLFFGSVLGYRAYQTSQDPTNVAVFLGISIVLGGLIGYLFYNSGKIIPAGVSAVMIVRTVMRYFSQPTRTPSNQFRSNFVNPTTDIQVIRGSQAVDTGFIRSIRLAYLNLGHRPLVIILGAVLIFSYLSIETSTSGPFHEIKRSADNIQASNTSQKWEVAIAYLLSEAMGVILKYEKQVVAIGFAWLPYLAKPSTESKYLSVLHSLIIFIFQLWHYFSFIILLANAHFIFISLRNRDHRQWIVIIVIAILLLLYLKWQGAGSFPLILPEVREFEYK